MQFFTSVKKSGFACTSMILFSSKTFNDLVLEQEINIIFSVIIKKLKNVVLNGLKDDIYIYYYKFNF